MKSARLFEILMLLVKERKVTAKYLADIFEVTTRTIYRDLDDLSLAGIPLYTIKGRNGGIFLSSDYVLDQTLITSKEKYEILFALKTITTIPNIEESHILSKLSSLFPINECNEELKWLDIDLSPWNSNNIDHNNIFSSLKMAINNKQLVAIKYVNTQGEEKYKELIPLKLLFKDKYWYLIACSDNCAQNRMYKINRIVSLNLLDNYFPMEITSKITYSYQNNFTDSTKLGNIKIRIAKKIAFRIFDDFHRDLIHVTPKYVEIKGCLEINDWLISKLLSYGENVITIEPILLKNFVISSAHKLLKNLK